jgi:integrase
MGVRDDGKPDRRHVMVKTEAEVIKKVRKLEQERDSGAVRKPGRPWKVDAWLAHWLENIARPSVRENSYEAYSIAVRRHLVPGIGAHRIDRLEPEHLEKLYARMIEKAKLKAGTAHQVHRTARTAFGEAVRRGHIVKNPAALAKAPRIDDEEVEPYNLDEIQRLLTAALKRRNSARWAVALALGLRQGEVLGLQWKDVDLAAGVLRVRRSRLRPKYEHGCAGGRCGKTPGKCPQRRDRRPPTADTKSRAGRRAIGLPPELVMLLRAHQAEQEAERRAARQLWQEQGWVFATETGEVINPITDYRHWKRLLKDAGVRNGRLHDARHTAATVLLILGVAERAAMGVMGWSSTSMTKRYQHLTDQIRTDIAKRVGGLIWATPEPVAGEHDQGDDGGPNGAQVPA